MLSATSLRMACVRRAMGLHVQTELELHCGRLLRPYAAFVVVAEAQCLDLQQLPSAARRTVSHVMIDFYIACVRANSALGQPRH